MLGDGWMASPTYEHMSLSKLQELVMDREAWSTTVPEIAEWDMTEWLNWTEVLWINPETLMFFQ